MEDWLTTVISAFPPMKNELNHGNFPVEFPPMDENVATAERINKAMNESNGEFILILKGDDLPDGNFIEQMTRMIDEYAEGREPGMVFWKDAVMFHRNLFDEIGHLRTAESVEDKTALWQLYDRLRDYALRANLAGFDEVNMLTGVGWFSYNLRSDEPCDDAVDLHDFLMEYRELKHGMREGRKVLMKGYRIFYPT